MIAGKIQGWNLGGRQIKGRLLVPTARERIGIDTQALDPKLAAQIIFESGTQFLIIGTSTSCGMGASQNNSLGLLFSEVQELFSRQAETRTFYTLINTSRSTTAQEAVDRALLGHSLVKGHPVFGTTLVKLEVFNPADHATVDKEVARAVEQLKKANPSLEIMPFISKDPDLAVDLVIKFQCPAVRIFGSAIGSGMGLGDEKLLERIVRDLHPTPVIVEGGLGTAAHVRRAREIGAAACLINAAIAEHNDPVAFARELRIASELPI